MRELKQGLLAASKTGWKGRTFTGAWIETKIFCGRKALSGSHLHRCVNWNSAFSHAFPFFKVAPSQVRELKQQCYSVSGFCRGRTFTGAWIETSIFSHYFWNSSVAPSQVRELKPWKPVTSTLSAWSHLHRCVNWNSVKDNPVTIPLVAPSQVRELKRLVRLGRFGTPSSHLHRCVNWN